MMYGYDMGDFCFYLDQDFGLDENAPTQVKAVLWYCEDWKYNLDLEHMDYLYEYAYLEVDLETTDPNIPWSVYNEYDELLFDLVLYQDGSSLYFMVTGWQAGGEACFWCFFVEIIEVWQYYP